MAVTILIDMRCQQDPVHAERGIATHARSAILLAREVSAMAREARIVGLIDPRLAALPVAVAAAADEIRTTAYAADLAGDLLFLNPSPMGENQVMMGRPLLDPRVRSAAMVYDFIPFEEQNRYLKGISTRLDYFTSMAWLDRYDLFLPISADTAARLGRLFALNGRGAVVTGVPLSPWFETAPPLEVKTAPPLGFETASPLGFETASPGGFETASPWGFETAGTAVAPAHILAVAGDDPRKNPELLVRAHAGSALLQGLRIPLLITGNYQAGRQADFRALAVTCGGDPALVHLPGRVSNEALAAQYRGAWCVATPSRAEGFSMPVIEAMACGVPSLASDIPVHAALVTDPALRFGVEDVARLRGLLERCVTEPEFRAAAVAGQAAVWRQFRAQAVAKKVWSAVETLLPLPVVARIGARPRVAMVTPLPPGRSGVADYSAAVAKSLGRLVDLTLVSQNGGDGVLPLSAIPYLAPAYDRVVSVMGNSGNHFGIHDLLLRYGGACICHDARLLDFTNAKFGMVAAAVMAGKELGRTVSRDEVEAWLGDERLRQADFFGDLVAAARPLIFHTRYSAAKVKARFLPFALYRPWGAYPVTARSREAARARLGIDANARVIASFGFIHGSKGIDGALRALALLRDRGLGCELYWVGQVHQNIASFEALAEELGVGRQVHFTDRYFDEDAYRDFLLAADFGLQLRLGTPGNVSGALSDCIAAGLPCVAGADIADNIDAPSFVRRVKDTPDPEEIAKAFAGLFEQGAERQWFKEECLAYCELHGMEAYAKGLCEILGI